MTGSLTGGGMTGCAVQFKYNNPKFTGAAISPILCQDGNYLGLDMQYLSSPPSSTQNVFLNPNNNSNFYLYSTFGIDQSKPTTFYWYDNNSGLPACPSNPFTSQTGVACTDLYGSFNTWDYSQMSVDSTKLDTTFSALPYANISSFTGPCNQPPFPNLF